MDDAIANHGRGRLGNPAMKASVRGFLAGVAAIVFVLLLVGAAVLWSFVRRGVSTRTAPSAIETRIAAMLRGAAIPAELQHLSNPVPRTEAALADGLAHFADHCALCHGNDGRADNFYGRNMFPPPPDMTTTTQRLTDGEIYAIIENGVRLTGMPAFGDGTADNQSSWNLVHFIRHLPQLSPEELQKMESLNPKSPAALAAEQEEGEFLEGTREFPPTTPPPSHDGHDHVH